MNRLTVYAIIAIAIFVSGVYAGWRLYGLETVKSETYAASERQQDGSLVLERKPDAKARSKQAVPKGGTVERVMEVEVQGKPSVSTKSGDASVPCPPVKIDMTLVKMPDESRRVVASSPNGEIVGGVDIPVESARIVPSLKWAAGLSVNPLNRTPGIFIDRDFGPFRVGAEFNKLSTGYDARLKVGIRF